MQVWNINDPPALNAGTYRMLARISQTSNYYGYDTKLCEFVVAQAVPDYAKPSGLTAKYGQTLSEIALTDPEGNLPGTWCWQTPDTVLDRLGTQTYYADFTPDDTNYKDVTGIAIHVTVSKADGEASPQSRIRRSTRIPVARPIRRIGPGFPSGRSGRTAAHTASAAARLPHLPDRMSLQRTAG